MKKILVFLGCILIVILILICYMANNDKKYVNKIKDNIYNKAEIKNISYINKYDNNYIVLNKEKLYLINKDYDIIVEKDVYLIHENTRGYDIIYKDDIFMYLNSYIKKDTLVYEYYDIYDYELIKRVFVGGMYE